MGWRPTAQGVTLTLYWRDHFSRDLISVGRAAWPFPVHAQQSHAADPLRDPTGGVHANQAAKSREAKSGDCDTKPELKLVPGRSPTLFAPRATMMAPADKQKQACR